MTLSSPLRLATPLAVFAGGAAGLAAQMLGPGWLAPLPGATVAETGALSRLARRLQRNPNDPELHLRTAEAYFSRGAQDDARRVRRHLERAVQLDPEMDGQVETEIRRFRPGVQPTARTAAPRRVDDLIRESLPLIGVPASDDGPAPPPPGGGWKAASTWWYSPRCSSTCR